MSEFAIWLTLGTCAISAGVATMLWAGFVVRDDGQSMLGETDWSWLGWAALGLAFILAGGFLYHVAYGALPFSQ